MSKITWFWLSLRLGNHHQFVLQTNQSVAEKHNEYFVYKRYYDEKSTNLFK